MLQIGFLCMPSLLPPVKVLYDYNSPILFLVGRTHLFFNVLLNGHVCRFNKTGCNMFGVGDRWGEVSGGQI